MNQKLSLTCLMIFIFTIIYLLCKPKETLYEAKWDDNSTLAITIDGEISTTFPTTNAYEGTVSCTTGTGTVSWNGSKWVLTTSGITKGSTKCNAIFTTKVPTLAETLLANNEVKSPLTTPGVEVSAYKESEVTTTYSSSVSSTYQSYYVTYGTGWEANGTKFNLTGTAVTTSTYANSYASLVGKYISSSLYDDLPGSNTVGEMVTTTNLTAVWYIISATDDGFTYKAIGSNKNVNEALLASTEDDYGTSYYFRGNVKNNFVEFANKCWRIVRIGGDNTIKLILHNDNTTNVSNPCLSENNGDTAAFAHYSETSYTSSFNDKWTDNAYVGFMYGTPGSSTYEATHANTNKSTILTNLETWYNNNLKGYESLIADNVFCADKNNITDTRYNPYDWRGVAGLGYGDERTYYESNQRLVSSSGSAGGTGPSLKCNGELSKITNKVGLITVDELVYAGYAAYISGSTSYLQENTTGTSWWSLTPASFNGNAAFVWCVYNVGGSLDGMNDVYSHGIRPYISLKSSTKVSNGTGTSEDPYIVSV